ncbi:MAG: DEAD/DEAH box helicase, partial [Clostridiales bacterium]|nr:DEAD/DEAH box helicase [Clostridiales bacterium]
MKKFNFKHLGLSQESLDAVEDLGFEQPTEIQHESIPHILKGRDVIGHSRTGTGKTLAFGLPAVDIVNENQHVTQVLVLCPTRELTEQVSGEIRKVSTYKMGLKVVAIYGGASMPDQIRKLRNGAHIVVGTPGRIMDHMRRKTLKLNNLQLMVLDEADEMLNMGFRDDIETVLKDVPEESSMVLFSATMSRDIMRITKNYQTNAKVIKAVDQSLTVATVDQWYVDIRKANKLMAVHALLKYHTPKLALIFCNTKRMVDDLVSKLQQGGVSAVALHGDLNQNARNRVMSGFRSGAMPVLVATDVAARGIDVDDVEMVINYDIPQDDEYYVH